jgi:hypothetical protein
MLGRKDMRELSEAERVVWRTYLDRTSQAARAISDAFNEAREALAEATLRSHGLSPVEWALDLDSFTMRRRSTLPKG